MYKGLEDLGPCMSGEQQGIQDDGKTKRVWGKRDEAEFSREQAWQVLKATLCLQSSKEQSWGVNGARWP